MSFFHEYDQPEGSFRMLPFTANLVDTLLAIYQAPTTVKADLLTAGT